MSQPLLTDEIIERYNHGEDLEELLYEHELKTGQTIRIEEIDIDRIIKSRRIENAKKNQFRRKLNMILAIILVLLCLLAYAIFNW
ncbi:MULTISPECIES: cell wall synthase accessory phosphoprotein MacP [Streptococcus]|uniref:Cell wall synthase accessory phosphoprotein MacP n=1 Tax=Streptococcus caledonicus TaxID=2614158 RepID=A0ABW0UGT0_9STRE|nr:cell wall synthase accessory phosphoprotein MacP [Streptococcus sp. S784/96/1]